MIQPKSHLKKIVPYPPGKTEEEIKKELGISGKIYKMNSNENPLGPSPKAVEVIKNTCLYIHRYPEASYTELREAIAKFHKVDKAQIIVGNGSDEVLEFVFKAFLNQKEKIVITKPSFLMYEKFAEIYDIKVEKIPLSEDFTHNLSEIKKNLLEDAKIAFIDHPHNPTGTIIPKRVWESFFKDLPEDKMVVIDEAYADFIEEKDTLRKEEFLNYHPSVLVVRTFSKSLGLAGLRLGYGIGREEIISFLDKVRQPFNINILAVKVGIAVLEDRDYILKCKQTIITGRNYLINNFQKLGFKIIPSQANFIMVYFGEKGKEIYNSLLKNGFLIRPLSPYGFDNWFRISVGLPEENKALIDTISKILEEI